MEVNSIEELSFQLTSIWLQIKALEADIDLSFFLSLYSSQQSVVWEAPGEQ